MIEDIEEFKAVLPKSGHRCKVKKVLAMLELQESSTMTKLCLPKVDQIKGIEATTERLVS